MSTGLSPMPRDPGVVAYGSVTPRDPRSHVQGMVLGVGIVASAAVDRFGGADSKVLRPGTLMARIDATGKWTPVFAAEALSVVAIGSIILYVGAAKVGRFVAGDNVKVGKPGSHNIITGVEQDMGAILTVYPTSGTIAITTGAISAVAVSDYVFVEPATADGSGDAKAVLLEHTVLRDTAGVACEPTAQIVVGGHVRSSVLLGGNGRAYITLAGQGVAIPAGVVIVDPQ